MIPFNIQPGDALDILPTLPSDWADAIVTDPPYSSGGFTRGDRTQVTSKKYSDSETINFTGDHLDSPTWILWCRLWIAECYRISKPSSYFLMFTDWRQLPSASAALQMGGYIWRGLIPWDKTEAARPPHTGYFRHQAEYIVWGTKGVSQQQDHGPWPGAYRHPVVQAEKQHPTGKPTALMADLVLCAPPGGIVLDPFAGSGSTGIGCVRTGRNFHGIEKDPYFIEIAQRRLQEEIGDYSRSPETAPLLAMAATGETNAAATWATEPAT